MYKQQTSSGGQTCKNMPVSVGENRETSTLQNFLLFARLVNFPFNLFSLLHKRTDELPIQVALRKEVKTSFLL
jgi:hypothetical protein